MKIQITTDNDEVVYEYQADGVIEPYSVIGAEMREAMRRAIDKDVKNARNARNASRPGPWKEIGLRIAPRIDAGCDYGIDGEILLEHNDVRLVWRNGSKQWNGRGNPQKYYPTELQLFDYSKIGDWPKHMTLHEGGRLTKKIIEEHADRIKKAFGVDELPEIKKGSTYVFVEAG
jgi:hypothetical protein